MESNFEWITANGDIGIRFFHSIDDGPRHVPMGFTSGLIVDDDFHYRKPIMYHYIGHISKYIAPGAKRIGWSKYGANLDVTAAVNPDGSYVVILLNRTKEDSGCFLRVNGHIMRVDLPAETLSTVVIEKYKAKIRKCLLCRMETVCTEGIFVRYDLFLIGIGRI